MVAGRRPIPTALKLLRGNPGHRPLNDREPAPKAKLPKVPEYLSDVAKQEWRRTGRRLAALGLVTEIDGTALAAYCVAFARWVDAEKQIQQSGTVIKVGKMLQVSPYLAIANKAMAQMCRLLGDFGMTPSSRSRVKAEKDNGINDEEAQFFGVRRS